MSLTASNVNTLEFAYQENAGRLEILSSSLQAAVFHNSTFKGLHLSLQYATRKPVPPAATTLLCSVATRGREDRSRDSGSFICSAKQQNE